MWRSDLKLFEEGLFHTIGSRWRRAPNPQPATHNKTLRASNLRDNSLLSGSRIIPAPIGICDWDIPAFFFALSIPPTVIWPSPLVLCAEQRLYVEEDRLTLFRFHFNALLFVYSYSKFVAWVLYSPCVVIGFPGPDSSRPLGIQWVRES